MKYTEAERMEVAETIKEQMGGKMAMMMIGAKALSLGKEDELALGIRFTGSRVYNYVKVTLDVARDTYVMFFGKIVKNHFAKSEELDDVYCDQLMDIFESKTGLYLTFAPRS